MRIRDIMHDIMRVPYDISVASVVAVMDRKCTGSVLLEDRGEAVWIITERDVLRKVVAKNRNPMNVKALDIASYPLITVGPEESLEEAARIMGENNIRRILVRDGSKIIGKVTAGAITKNMRYIHAERILQNRY